MEGTYMLPISVWRPTILFLAITLIRFGTANAVEITPGNRLPHTQHIFIKKPPTAEQCKKSEGPGISNITHLAAGLFCVGNLVTKSAACAWPRCLIP